MCVRVCARACVRVCVSVFVCVYLLRLAAEVEDGNAEGDQSNLHVLSHGVRLSAENNASRHHRYHLARLAEHLQIQKGKQGYQ